MAGREVQGDDGRCSQPFQGCGQYDDAESCEDNGCSPKLMWPYLEDGDKLCVGKEFEFVGCVELEQACGDALTTFCDEDENMWQSPDTCGAPGLSECNAPDVGGC